MSGYTPSPWKWYWRETDGEADCGVFSETMPGQAYSVCRAPRYQTEERWEADARLIAAAPDMLEAHYENVRCLTMLLNELQGRVEAGKLAVIQTAINRSIDVIAKAEDRK